MQRRLCKKVEYIKLKSITTKISLEILKLFKKKKLLLSLRTQLNIHQHRQLIEETDFSIKKIIIQKVFLKN